MGTAGECRDCALWVSGIVALVIVTGWVVSLFWVPTVLIINCYVDRGEDVLMDLSSKEVEFTRDAKHRFLPKDLAFAR